MIGKMNIIDEIERYVKLQGLFVSKSAARGAGKHVTI
ncbi:Uncharacterised protein [Streptococcus acidominimus]|uniref:Uncharacterized protein n=1 Tax=Streptococcus acidominimus TaxID=1326 RepID=A0A380JKU1_STRAI|nr:Uncharacterised protein [Streptococcus acidominimus]